MYIPVQWLKPYLLPLATLILAVALLPYAGNLDDSYRTLLAYMPYALAGTAFVLGQQFVQGRLSLAACNILIGYAIIQVYLQSPLEQNQTRAIFTALGLFWPLNIFLIYWLPERKFLSTQGALFALLVGTEIGLTYWLIHYQTDYAQILSQFFSLYPFNVASSEHINWILPAASTLAIALSSVAIAVHIYFKPHRSNIVLLCTLLMMTLTCSWFDQVAISGLFSSLAALALLITLFLNSHDLAFLDELTGLPARRALLNELKHCGRHYSLAMADIDNFKSFNDTYGHDTGDEVLRLVAQQLGKVTGGGKAFRYGGEEFTILFKGKDTDQAKPHLEAVREAIADYPLTIRNKNDRPDNKKTGKSKRNTQARQKQVNITVSFGLSQAKKDQQPEEVMKVADQALYKAKENGRNRVETKK
jgi:GGDEF domain-containing protein